jgi:hypothetical protein
MNFVFVLGVISILVGGIWFFIALKNYKDYIKNKDKKND